MRSVTSDETVVYMTMTVAVNATGNHIPPMLSSQKSMLTATPTVSVGGSYKQLGQMKVSLVTA